MLKDAKERKLLTRFSSFNSVENILGDVVDMLLRNDRLKRLLYYTDKHALRLPKLTQEQSFSLINRQIQIVPKFKLAANSDQPMVFISADAFRPQPNFTDFRSFILMFTIICLYDNWLLEDFKLRPYAIAGEIDAMINNSSISGKGIADFVFAERIIGDDNRGGFALTYNVETLKNDTVLQPMEE